MRYIFLHLVIVFPYNYSQLYPGQSLEKIKFNRFFISHLLGFISFCYTIQILLIFSSYQKEISAALKMVTLAEIKNGAKMQTSGRLGSL